MKPKLTTVNTLLLFVIIGINVFIIASPMLPAFRFWWDSRQPQAKVLAELAKPPSQSTPKDPNADLNHLVIPGMLMNELVHEGANEATLNKGLWRRPLSSTPDRGGNTVIVAHRFTYTNPRGVFYFLDKLKLGDTISLFWNGTQYSYSVIETKVVKASEVNIESPTNDDRLTLYTCTPLWNPKDRLAVIARLENTYE